LLDIELKPLLLGLASLDVVWAWGVLQGMAVEIIPAGE
jgi:hypothetical protein